MKYQHYAPNAPLYLVNGSRAFLQSLIEDKQKEGLRVGVLATEDSVESYHSDVVIACGKRSQLESVATALYETLRKFNQEKVDIIFSEMFPNTGVGHAIMNRLQKAAGNKMITE
jgi:L-threonylcarbamoyladenylate synthase